MDLTSIPQELKDLRQWVLADEQKQPRTVGGKPAAVDDPSTWNTYDAVVEALERHKNKQHLKSVRYIGVGFVLTEEDPYCFIDLDKTAVTASGMIAPWAQDIVDQLDSYTEVSLSGRGLHVLARGTKPGSRCRQGNIEVYDRNRYVALTGEVQTDRTEIEDRQGQLEQLYLSVFGGAAQEDEMLVGDLVLDPHAGPPTAKLDELLAKNRQFSKSWRHNREGEFPSLSEYDESLAAAAIRDGWTDQEVADLIIAFRRKWGETPEKAQKALRPDYIKRTIGHIRGSSEALAMLPFKVARVIQIGEKNSQWELLTDDGRKIEIGSTETFRSAQRVSHVLWEMGIDLSKQAAKNWDRISKALREIRETKTTITRDETTEAWIKDFAAFQWERTEVLEEGKLEEALNGDNSVLVAEGGIIYVRAGHMVRHARVSLNWNKNIYQVAADLASVGFEKLIWDGRDEEGRRRRITWWRSPPGWYRSDE